MTIAENRMLAVEEALARVLEAAGSPLPAEDVDLWRVFSAADALAVVPEGVDRLDAGSEVEIRWLRI